MNGNDAPAQEPAPQSVIPTQKAPQQQPVGRTIFELIGLKKEQSDRIWKVTKVSMIFVLISYFMGVVLDLFLGQEILRYILPILVVVFLLWKFFNKDIKDVLGKK
jgi:short subunit fatty acids transporter